MSDPFLRLNGLSLAFMFRKCSDKIYDIAEFGMEGCLTVSFLGWKLLMSLGHDEPTFLHV